MFDEIIQNYVDKAVKLNKKNKSCHIALLIQGKNKVISHGFNQMDRQSFRGKSIISLHAEIDCLRKYRPISDLKKRNYSLVVVKISKNKHNYYCSLPCKECTEFLINVGFKSIYCSNCNGDITKLNLNTYIPYNL